jgi:flagellar hook-associated protein 3 FlgL
VHLTQIVSGTYGENSRERVADEIDEALEQMVSSANTKYIDQYIFGGSNTSSLPYAVERTDGKITSVVYQGGQQDRYAEMAPGIKSTTIYAGDDIFSSNDRSDPVFTGSSSAANGSGTSNAKGNTWLTVTNDGTNYKLSIDDGATEITVPSTGDISNIAVTNSNGDVLYVDATNINNVGVEIVQIPGTHDLFGTLIGIRDILENSKNLSENDVIDLIQKSEGSLDEINNHMTGKQVSIGAKISFLDNLKNNIDDIKFNTESEIAYTQEADIAQIAVDLSRRDALYQMSLSLAGRLMSTSLLDYI